MQSTTRGVGKEHSAVSAAPKTGTPAPYGHACTNCARAKCKCIHRATGGACERCFRLSKDCTPSVPNRKRNPRKATGSRTAHLEEKLDDLVSLIRSQASGKAPGGTALLDVIVNAKGAPSTVPSTSSASSPNASSTAPISGEAYATDATTPSSAGLNSECDYPIPDDVAEANLARFRHEMVRFYPVVYLPPSMTAQELRRTRPFLYLAIMACASRSTREAHAIGDRVRRTIANKVVLELDRSLDLMQGLLIFMQWPNCHKVDRPWLTLWTSLSVVISQDLGLTSINCDTSFSYVKKFWMQKSSCRNQPSQARTTEECRTIMAAYVWTSTCSQMTRRDNALRWTPFMEQCLRSLLERPEYEGDSVLAVQVRCALISQSITDLSIQQALRGEAQIRIPMYFHHSLSSQLDEIWRSLPAPLLQNENTLLHLHATEVAVHELALNVDPAAVPASEVDIIKRLEALQRCMKAAESFFQTWDGVTPAQHVGLTFIAFIQLLHVIVALFRLSTVDNIPGWDPVEARNKLPLFPVLDRIAERMEASIAAMPIWEDDGGEEGSVWSKAAKVMRLMKHGIRNDFPSLDPLGGGGGGGGGIEQVAPVAGDGTTNLQGPAQDISQDGFMTSLGDDPWLSSIFVPFPWDSMNF